MAIENVMLTLSRIPEIKAIVDSGTDWKILGGFILTATAVIAGAAVTVLTFRKTVRSQEDLARKVSVKQSRQEWINELRNSCANYVSSVMALREHQMYHESQSKVAISLMSSDPTGAVAMLVDWGTARSSLYSSAYSLKAKIILLSNPKEQLFKELISQVNAALGSAGEDDETAIKHCDKIISVTQEILKIEWDRARKMID